MKLLMENWRNFINESVAAPDCGILYVFEDNDVKETSFYNTLNLLSESDDDFNHFLETWERSVDYHIERLNEGKWSDFVGNPIIYLSTQVFEFIHRVGEKAIQYWNRIRPVMDKILNFAERFQEKNPTLYRIAKISSAIIVVSVGLYALEFLFGSSLTAQAGEVVEPGFDAAGEFVQKVVHNERELTALQNMAERVGADGLASQLGEIIKNPEDVRMYQIAPPARADMKELLDVVNELGLEPGEGGEFVKAANKLGEVGDAAGGALDAMASGASESQRGNAALRAINQLNTIRFGGDAEKVARALEAISGDPEIQDILNELPGELKNISIDNNLSSDDATAIAKHIQATLS